MYKVYEIGRYLLNYIFFKVESTATAVHVLMTFKTSKHAFLKVVNTATAVHDFLMTFQTSKQDMLKSQ